MLNDDGAPPRWRTHALCVLVEQPRTPAVRVRRGDARDKNSFREGKRSADGRMQRTCNETVRLPERRTSPAEVKQPPRPKLIEVMGPGLITGASDDDPSGIATYSQAGAEFGYGLSWTLLLTYPLMRAIQQISGEIGRVTGRGIAGNLRRHYAKWLLYGVVGLLLIANTINIGADLGAMGAALKLLIGGPALIYVGLFALLTAGLEIFVRYARYVSILKWLTLSLFAYVATVFIVHVPWQQVVVQLVVPHLTRDKNYIVAVVAVFGTTISPYLFFWQAGRRGRGPDGAARSAPAALRSATSTGRTEPHPARHLCRHGILEYRGARDHAHGSRDAARPR